MLLSHPPQQQQLDASKEPDAIATPAAPAAALQRHPHALAVPDDDASRLSSSASSSPSASSPASSALGAARLCAACRLPLTAPTIRAMDLVFHKACFVCADCGKPVVDRFFPPPPSDISPEPTTDAAVAATAASSAAADPSTYPPPQPPPSAASALPLCEHDFFRRKSLLCHVCGNALRGDYVMAVGHKYHLEHFACATCHRVFLADDNYYERDGNVYCHYDFSTRFADRCEGCNSAILKQFIENLRNGRQEHWHPECYMIHKFWNIRLVRDIPPSSPSNPATSDAFLTPSAAEMSPESLKQHQADVENRVYRIWTVLSGYEEVSAACISEMLQHASGSSVYDSVLDTGRLIYRIHVLFNAIDFLLLLPAAATRPLGKEPKTLCKNVVSFLTSLPGGIPASKESAPSNGKHKEETPKDILDLVTSIAHYLKLLIQYSLDIALLEDSHTQGSHALDSVLDWLFSHNSPPVLSRATLIPSITDQCVACRRGIEDKCIRLPPLADSEDRRDRRWHITGSCFVCTRCTRSLADEVPNAFWSESQKIVLCSTCVRPDDKARARFVAVSRLQQYGFLLTVALQRVYKNVEAAQPADVLQRAASSDKRESIEGYTNTLTDIRRLRSTRFKRAISDAKGKQTRISHNNSTASNSSQQHRHNAAMASVSPATSISRRPSSTRRKRSATTTSRRVPSAANVVNGTSSSAPRSISPSSSSIAATPPHELSRAGSTSRTPPPQLPGTRPFPTSTPEKHDILFGEKYLTLDDIPRIVAAEQAREQRPNAYRHQRRASSILGSGGQTTKLVSKTPTNGLIGSTGDSHPPSLYEKSISSYVLPSKIDDSIHTEHVDLPARKFFSELTDDEYAFMRRRAMRLLQPLLAPYFSEKELHDMIRDSPSAMSPSNASKSGFWDKVSKAFSKSPSPANGNTSKIVPGGSTTSTVTTAGGHEKLRRRTPNAAMIAAAVSPPGVFNVALDVLVERSGTKSELGVGAGPLRVPAFLDDVITAMRRKDMSVEGVFRKNGNIRKLKELTEGINKSANAPRMGVDLDAEGPVQLAALLKKFLRDLPDPLLTFRMYKIWLASQRIPDDETRLRVLHLCCCTLPRAHRDSMEIIFNFLLWVASFSHVDEESGSKMDRHNISTVITPNILYLPQNMEDDPTQQQPMIVPMANAGEEDQVIVPTSGAIGGLVGDSHFLAIEAVNMLIANNDEFSVVPDDIIEAMQQELATTPV
ncbi:uncharacterized protein V1518DRAFT_386990 [Limtongia smithiae]|uniref:uncharacterized protein n=1 Tax=Limtongia smithiae TaxID=1125753 RepID=UPI0034CDB288